MYRNDVMMDSAAVSGGAVCARQMRGSQLKWDKTTLAL